MDTQKLKRTARNITIQLEDGEIEFSRIGGRSTNGGIVFCLTALEAIYAEALNELRGYFSSEEWHFLQIVMEGQTPKEATKMCSKDEICRIVRNPKNCATARITGVDPNELAMRIQNELMAAHVYAIWLRVLDFHDHKQEYGREIFDWLAF